MIWEIIFGLSTIYCLSLLSQFLRNVRLAKSTRLPYICYPLSEFSIIHYTLFDTSFVPKFVNNCLPQWLADIVNDNIITYRWTVRDRRAKQLGLVNMVVTPTTLSCNVADATVVSQVCMERRMFPKPVWQYKPFELYGPSILTCEDTQWAHHRRHTASTFNESNNGLVWQVSIQQALDMTGHWEEKYKRSSTDKQLLVPAAKSDILKFTLNVLCSAGFGVSLPFKPGTRDKDTHGISSLFKDTDIPPEGFRLTFRDVMEYLNSNLNPVILANLIVPKWIPRMLMPFFKKDFVVYEDFRRYLEALIQSSKVDMDNAKSHDLLQGIVQSQRKDNGLTDSEIIGNLHIFTVAGHETTATTLRFALVLLAMYPSMQEWAHVCIKDVLKEHSSDPKDWAYSAIFPKLVAPLCVMLETLRLCPPVVTVPKWTAENSVSIIHRDQTYTLPPKVNINLNVNALHYSEEYWGPDVASFNPRRWDKSNHGSFLAANDGKTGLSGPGLEFENIHKPVRGAFIPFSDGFRACVGKRFSQVEFVAVMTIILSRYQVSLGKIDPEESEKFVYRRAQKVLNESATVLTLGMKSDVPLLLTERDSKA